MKLIIPEGVSSVSHNGERLEIKNGTIDVEGEALAHFQIAHGFKTEAEVAAEAEAAGKAAAIAAAVVIASKRK